ncbi:MAG: metallophosphoesterase [Myxococcota bacterium]
MPYSFRIALILLVFGSLFFGLNLYFYRRSAAVFALSNRNKTILGTTLVLGALCTIGPRVLERMLPTEASESLALFGSSIQMAVLLTSGFLFPIELLRMARGLAVRVKRMWVTRFRDDSLGHPRVEDTPSSDHARAGDVSEEAPEPLYLKPSSSETTPRRDFLMRTAWGGGLLLGTSQSIYGSAFGRHDYVMETVPVAMPNLPSSFHGYSLIQLSDIHFGTFVGEAELRVAEDFVRRAKPDLVVLTGDLVDHDPAFAPYVARLVQRLTDYARDGILAVPGNHDYYSGVEVVLGELERAGASVLRNASTLIDRGTQRLALLGVDDVWASRSGATKGPDLDRALQGVDEETTKLLLCHNPVFFPTAAGHVDLQLSGHTHGGQVAPFFNPADIVLPYGYVRGLYRRAGSQLYVNRGFGTAGPPTRIGSPPEITKIVLTT